MFNVHAAGGREMMMRTRDAVVRVTTHQGLAMPLIIAVTVLTSTDDLTLHSIGIESSAEGQVKRLAILTEEAGLDGVVASPREVELIRSAISRRDFVIVTPGVRPADSLADDQKRIATPGQTIAASADYLVVGRPITHAPDPRAAAKAILQEMAQAISN
jgi:orotidine-5'-phosphate decarboxylase